MDEQRITPGTVAILWRLAGVILVVALFVCRAWSFPLAAVVAAATLVGFAVQRCLVRSSFPFLVPPVICHARTTPLY